jgi:hypothetical protein
MAQQGKQMRVGACESFAYRSVKLVSLANGDRYEVDFNTFLLRGQALCTFEVLPWSNSGVSDTHSYL